MNMPTYVGMSDHDVLTVCDGIAAARDAARP
jgi:hypothetical protein